MVTVAVAMMINIKNNDIRWGNHSNPLATELRIFVFIDFRLSQTFRMVEFFHFLSFRHRRNQIDRNIEWEREKHFSTSFFSSLSLSLRKRFHSFIYFWYLKQSKKRYEFNQVEILDDCCICCNPEIPTILTNSEWKSKYKTKSISYFIYIWYVCLLVSIRLQRQQQQNQ